MHKSKQQGMTLTAYATLAAAVIPMVAPADVVYTDVDPDVLVNEPGTGISLDLNGDGTNDFNFFFSSANSAVFTYFGGLNWYIINGIFAAPQNDNAIAAFTGSGGAYAYPYAIGSGINIGPYAGQFLTNPYQTLAYQFYALIGSYLYYPIFAGGDWVFGQEDKFVGLQLAVGDSTYYGWIRLTTDPSNRAFTVKDFAWENNANTSIETFLQPTAITNPELLEVEMYASGNNIIIHLNEDPKNAYLLNVYNLSGQLILQDNILQKDSRIMVDAPQGMYIVELTGNNQKAGKKLFIAGT
ncbi:MAG TPA: T9SS type A sorting domain-containing protein [Chitinophagales bacterium]|nr:T9SS type A sorting domain-containing protein [Chitinophagales bacterium]HMZ88244.1 T9SS type A sorting domain-containing protein [Chitinophagales bacterium]HNJ88181.1 T9SS type A sorting domain-containing protein [Chitinophagales bacterium]HNK98062.1 T9SS type A sorting domain-containing protein [Chitinophagales bacterium]HNM29751.1 T9SS type A sorting domain-containing protein [Chitinophagales bacterium]